MGHPVVIINIYRIRVPEVPEVDLRDVARANVPADAGDSPPGAAPAVVPPVQEAGEEVLGPCGADHQVGNGGLHGRARVAEGVYAAAGGNVFGLNSVKITECALRIAAKVLFTNNIQCRNS